MRFLGLLVLLLGACATTVDPDSADEPRASAPPKAGPVVAEPPPALPPVIVLPPQLPDVCSGALQVSEWDEAKQRYVARPNSDLDAVLEACAGLRDSLAWIDGAGRRLAYAAWTEEQRRVVRTDYQHYVLGKTSVPVDCPTPERNLAPGALAAGVAGPLYLGAEQAFSLYAAQVAHALALEASGELGWRLRGFPAAERAALLSADGMFATIQPGAVVLPAGLVAGRDLRRPASWHSVRARCPLARALAGSQAAHAQYARRE